MLTREENETLTRVGPGTPCGEFLRRYWHPIAAASELTAERPKMRIRILRLEPWIAEANSNVENSEALGAVAGARRLSRDRVFDERHVETDVPPGPARVGVRKHLANLKTRSS